MEKLIILLAIIMISYILNRLYQNSYNKLSTYVEQLYPDELKCRPSTPNNPFANFIVTSKQSNPMISACKDLKVGDNYRDNLYLNSKYAYNRYFFNKDYLDNNFITTPVTKNPNDLKQFGDYLYNNKNWLECKADKFCLPWSDIRYNNRYVNK